MQRGLIALVLAALVAPAAIAGPQPSLTPTQPADPVFGVFKALVADHQKENICISPLNIELALRMVREGARGTTKQQLVSFMGTTGKTMTDDQNPLGKLSLPTNTKAPVRVDIGNALVSRSDSPFNQDYVALIRSKYGGETFVVGKNQAAVVEKVNAWVSTKTHGMINSALPPKLDDEMRFCLVSTVYFKGGWKEPFKQTKRHSFAVSPTQVKIIDALNNDVDDYFVIDTPEMLGLSLPYGVEPNEQWAAPNGRWTMFFFVPKGKHTLAELEQSMTGAKLKKLVSEFASEPAIIYVPKYDVEYSTSLRGTLKALGVKDAFDPQHADLSGMFPKASKAYLLDVFHKTKMKIDEKGTEAAAVVAIPGGEGTGAPSDPPPHRPPLLVSLDRPYMLLIRDNKTGAVLFTAQVADAAPTVAPSANGVKMRKQEEAAEKKRWDEYWTDVMAWNSRHHDREIAVPAEYKAKSNSQGSKPKSHH